MRAATLYSRLLLAVATAAAATPSTPLVFQLGAPLQAQQAQQAQKQQQQQQQPEYERSQQLLAQIPAWTYATLEAGHGRLFVSAPATAAGALVFANVTAGSYLGEVHCSTHVFAPLRVDVDVLAEGVTVTAFETFRGNDWNNRGERVPAVAAAAVPTLLVRALSAERKNYYTERTGFSVLSVLRSPMILLGIVSMAIVFGMPYMIDNMDPEMKAEWEARQKGGGGGLESLLGGGGGGGGGRAPPGANFDMAAYLAGSTTSKPSSGGSGGGGAAPRKEGVTR